MEVALQEKLTLTIAEAAAITGIGAKQLAEWAETEDSFPVFKIGNKRVIEVTLLREWLQLRCKARVGMDSTRVARIIRRRKRVG
ncbi:helix-turn-helix domain-containing protein [Megasphaera vaginalis (ex Srinivasan et al. 2021)]|uniref:helix-turn-helix domain-containing protein n=1 Tax=Megasphaera vaginalis (ex Srinivasan et al. 2021) TaxID=1111454 RepID=UPI000561DC32|nr:helix-turn-helix domain-containing protein [Megasphaera vaginalis (ex Srinivasan et al. 2021)]